MPLYVSSTRAYRQEAKIVLYSLWYHHTYRCIKLVNIKINILRCTVSKISKFSVLCYVPFLINVSSVLVSLIKSKFPRQNSSN